LVWTAEVWLLFSLNPLLLRLYITLKVSKVKRFWHLGSQWSTYILPAFPYPVSGIRRRISHLSSALNGQLTWLSGKDTRGGIAQASYYHFLSKASGYVAGVRAVFALLVAVRREFSSTVGAGEMVERFSVHIVWMGIPPSDPALIGAECASFVLGCLHYRLAALFAVSPAYVNINGRVRHTPAESIPPAK
jgi:hypothetical protein